MPGWKTCIYSHLQYNAKQIVCSWRRGISINFEIYPPPSQRKLTMPPSLDILYKFKSFFRQFPSPLPGCWKFPPWVGYGSFWDYPLLAHADLWICTCMLMPFTPLLIAKASTSLAAMHRQEHTRFPTCDLSFSVYKKCGKNWQELLNAWPLFILVGYLCSQAK